LVTANPRVRGKVVDKRADIWAFGCVLYEMLTGMRPFGGDDVTDTIAAVVRADPDWSKLRADTPTAIRRLLRRCLEKDRMRRLPDAADARLEIDEALSPLAGDANMEHAAHLASGAVVAGWQRVLPWAGAGVLGVALMLMLWAPWRAAAPPRVTRTTITTSGPAALTINGTDRDLALSPDGTHVVYVGNSGTQLFVRALDALEPVAIATIPFDPTRLETHGTAVPVLPRRVTTGDGVGDFAAAPDGTRVYVDAPGRLAANARTLVWVDRTGQRGAHRCAAARLRASAPLARRDAHRALQQGSGE
jgi:hypothetical protein